MKEKTILELCQDDLRIPAEIEIWKRLDPGTKEEITALAALKGMKPDEIILKAIAEYLGNVFCTLENHRLSHKYKAQFDQMYSRFTDREMYKDTQ